MGDLLEESTVRDGDGHDHNGSPVIGELRYTANEEQNRLRELGTKRHDILKLAADFGITDGVANLLREKKVL